MSTATVIIVIGPQNRLSQSTVDSSDPITVVNQDNVKRALEYTPMGEPVSSTEHVGPGSSVTFLPGVVVCIPYR